MNKKIYVALDTETTGLLKPDLTAIEFQPFMTELCMIKFDKNFEVIGKYNSLFKIPIPVPEIITKITGITDEALEDQPTFSEELKKISNFMTGANHVIGHNVNFDLDVLKFELRRIRKEHYFPWPINRNCTVEISFPIENKRMKLGNLYKMATGKNHDGAHRAEADVLATVECFVWLKENGYA